MKNYLPKVLITGGEGQLGKALQTSVFAKNFEVYACSRFTLDITDSVSIENFIKKIMPTVIVNAAAYTDVDSAEKNASEALRVNQYGAKNIAQFCSKYKIPLIHISTDYIFDGEKNAAYNETDAASPLNVYGYSKYLGEKEVRQHTEHHIILRISSVFSEYENNFLKTIMRLIKEKNIVHIVADQIVCPTYAGHAAQVIYSIIQQLSNEKYSGIYHYCDKESMSWYEFAVKISRVLNSEIKINAITSSEYNSLAKRPAYSVLACEKIKNVFDVQQLDGMNILQRIIKA